MADGTSSRPKIGDRERSRYSSQLPDAHPRAATHRPANTHARYTQTQATSHASPSQNMPNASAALLGLVLALASGNIRPGTAFLLPSKPPASTTPTTRLAAHSNLQAALHLMQQQKGPSGTGGSGRTGGGACFVSVSVCSCIYRFRFLHAPPNVLTYTQQTRARPRRPR